MTPASVKPDPNNPKLDEAAFQIEIILGPDGRPRYRLLTPHNVMGGEIDSLSDLRFALQKRQHNVIEMHTEDVTTRRWHIERERPALRWYCRQYGVPVPAWLQGNGGYDELSRETFVKTFGNAPLRVQEFRSWREVQALAHKAGAS